MPTGAVRHACMLRRVGGCANTPLAVCGVFWYTGCRKRVDHMRRNIGKLPHLLKREAEENKDAEIPHHNERKISPTNSAARNPAIAGKLTSMRQYAKKGK